MQLTKKQKDFCKFKAQGFSNEESAVKAGYSTTTAKTKSHNWLDKSEIKNEIERLAKKVEKVAAEKFEITAESVLNDIIQIKDRCMQKRPVMVKKGKDWVQKQEYCEETEQYEGVWSFESCAALKACELLGKHIGIFEKDNNQKRNIGFNVVVADEKTREAIDGL